MTDRDMWLPVDVLSMNFCNPQPESGMERTAGVCNCQLTTIAINDKRQYVFKNDLVTRQLFEELTLHSRISRVVVRWKLALHTLNSCVDHMGKVITKNDHIDNFIRLFVIRSVVDQIHPPIQKFFNT